MFAPKEVVDESNNSATLKDTETSLELSIKNGIK